MKVSTNKEESRKTLIRNIIIGAACLVIVAAAIVVAKNVISKEEEIDEQSISQVAEVEEITEESNEAEKVTEASTPEMNIQTQKNHKEEPLNVKANDSYGDVPQGEGVEIAPMDSTVTTEPQNTSEQLMSNSNFQTNYSDLKAYIDSHPINDVSDFENEPEKFFLDPNSIDYQYVLNYSPVSDINNVLINVSNIINDDVEGGVFDGKFKDFFKNIKSNPQYSYDLFIVPPEEIEIPEFNAISPSVIKHGDDIYVQDITVQYLPYFLYMNNPAVNSFTLNGFITDIEMNGIPDDELTQQMGTTFDIGWMYNKIPYFDLVSNVASVETDWQDLIFSIPIESNIFTSTTIGNSKWIVPICSNNHYGFVALDENMNILTVYMKG